MGRTGTARPVVRVLRSNDMNAWSVPPVRMLEHSLASFVGGVTSGLASHHACCHAARIKLRRLSSHSTSASTLASIGFAAPGS